MNSNSKRIKINQVVFHCFTNQNLFESNKKRFSFPNYLYRKCTTANTNNYTYIFRSNTPLIIIRNSIIQLRQYSFNPVARSHSTSSNYRVKNVRLFNTSDRYLNDLCFLINLLFLAAEKRQLSMTLGYHRVNYFFENWYMLIDESETKTLRKSITFSNALYKSSVELSDSRLVFFANQLIER